MFFVKKYLRASLLADRRAVTKSRDAAAERTKLSTVVRSHTRLAESTSARATRVWIAHACEVMINLTRQPSAKNTSFAHLHTPYSSARSRPFPIQQTYHPPCSLLSSSRKKKPLELSIDLWTPNGLNSSPKSILRSRIGITSNASRTCWSRQHGARLLFNLALLE
jgi:hypothetical protein